MTQEQVARVLGISQARVDQIESMAAAKFRKRWDALERGERIPDDSAAVSRGWRLRTIAIAIVEFVAERGRVVRKFLNAIVTELLGCGRRATNLVHDLIRTGRLRCAGPHVVAVLS